MKSSSPLLLSEALPQLSGELDRLLRAENRPELADQLSSLRIVDRCRCGDDFCATFYAKARSDGAWGPDHETLALDEVASGMLNVDVAGGRIVAVEALFRDDVRARLIQLLG